VGVVDISVPKAGVAIMAAVTCVAPFPALVVA